MNFRIADTFTESLARLRGDEQKAIKTTAFDLQIHPANPDLSFHNLNKARDKNFWCVRVSSDIRLIVHKTEGSLLICYGNHHDKAYDWAEGRKLKTTLKAGINAKAWDTLHRDTSRPFDNPKNGRIAVKMINHLGEDEVIKVF